MKVLTLEGLQAFKNNILSLINGKANTSHNHSASNITSGVLPIGRGGTGSSTAGDARANLGIDYYIAMYSVIVDNISVSAQSSNSGNISVSRADYTAVGVVGWSLGAATNSGTMYSLCFLYQLRVDMTDQRLYYAIRNTAASSNAKVKLTAYVLYRRN